MAARCTIPPKHDPKSLNTNQLHFGRLRRTTQVGVTTSHDESSGHHLLHGHLQEAGNCGVDPRRLRPRRSGRRRENERAVEDGRNGTSRNERLQVPSDQVRLQFLRLFGYLFFGMGPTRASWEVFVFLHSLVSVGPFWTPGPPGGFLLPDQMESCSPNDRKNLRCAIREPCKLLFYLFEGSS